MENKPHATFNDWLEIDLLLSFRHSRIMCKWYILREFSPWRAIWARRKFNRVIRTINELRAANARRGYLGETLGPVEQYIKPPARKLISPPVPIRVSCQS